LIAPKDDNENKDSSFAPKMVKLKRVTEDEKIKKKYEEEKNKKIEKDAKFV
jgi:hypothetical protein